MTIQTQLRRGTTTNHSTFTGAIAEVTVDTTKKTAVVHDGATAGGFPLQRELVSGTTIKTVNGTSILGSGNITISGGSSDAGSLTGTLSADRLGTHTTNQIVGMNAANNALEYKTISGTGAITVTHSAGVISISSSGSGATISNDNATDASYYIGMTAATSGAWSTAYVSDTGLYFNPSTGTLNATNFNSLSDQNLKTNIVDISSALDVVNKLQGVEFDFIQSGVHSSGVVAQQLEEVLPFLVSTNSSGIKSVNYDGIIGFLIEAIKELSLRN